MAFALQGMLSEDAARTRGVGNAGARAPLCGKIYDEQGETLTPTHTTKSGKRIRYYISRCLVTGKAKDHPNAWRLPAVALEDQMAGLIQTRLSTPSVIAALLPTGTASDLHEVTERAQTPASKLGGYQSDHTLELVEHIALSSGRVTVTLNMSQITTALDCSIDQLDASCLAWSAPFSLKRRGVETRLTLGSENAHVDPVLIRNVQRARDWYQQIVAGHTFSKITSESGVDKNRLKQILQLAFLAPDLLARITSGTQPNGFTSEWLKTNTLPTQWDAQRALFERL